MRHFACLLTTALPPTDPAPQALHAFDDLKAKDAGANRPGRPLLRLGAQRQEKDQ